MSDTKPFPTTDNDFWNSWLEKKTPPHSTSPRPRCPQQPCKLPPRPFYRNTHSPHPVLKGCHEDIRPCCARPQRAAPQAIIKRKNFFIFSIFFIASVSHPPDCLHLFSRFKEEREAACRTACHNSGIPIPVKTQTAKQQPHAYGYTYPHPPTKQGMQARVYTWSVSICCITLRSHLEFGDFLLRKVISKKTLSSILPSRHYGTWYKDMKFIWTPQKKNRNFFCKLPKREMGNLLFVILSTVSTRGFHIPVSTAQQTQTRESRDSCHNPKDSFSRKKRQNGRHPPPPPARNPSGCKP